MVAARFVISFVAIYVIIKIIIIIIIIIIKNTYSAQVSI